MTELTLTQKSRLIKDISFNDWKHGTTVSVPKGTEIIVDLLNNVGMINDAHVMLEEDEYTIEMINC